MTFFLHIQEKRGLSTSKLTAKSLALSFHLCTPFTYTATKSESKKKQHQSVDSHLVAVILRLQQKNAMSVFILTQTFKKIKTKFWAFSK